MQNEFLNHEYISIIKVKLGRRDLHKFNKQRTIKDSM